MRKNEELYRKLKALNQANVVPLQYIACKDEMNQLYDQIDGIITKPGGVTISESLYKRKPIFIYHALPGQEVINLQQLKKLGLIYEFNQWKKQCCSIDEYFNDFYESKSQWIDSYDRSISQYHQTLAKERPVDFIQRVIFGSG
uniref:hypothetical protein n=1 Tax=Litoribacterium kuwaitense TaxID=1398745 RepID=UPI001FE3710A|nr:hypothetical protein [Litoribacterium kuwaitense]